MTIPGSVLARRLSFELKSVASTHPAVAIPIARLRHGVVVGQGTEVVIEGFPRTGTSFAVSAFRRAQARRVDIACHVHAPAQILEGVRRRLPTLVVVREPAETVISFAVRNHHLALSQALRGFARFYEAVIPVLDGVVVADFAEVTQCLDRSIGRVNGRFGTSFVPFSHTDDEVRAVFAEIDEDYARRVHGESFERAVARPSEARDALKQKIRSRYWAPSLAALRTRAELAYDGIARGADAR